MDSPSPCNEEAAFSIDKYDVPILFKNPRADAIVRSSDGVEFSVWKAILAEASEVFRDLFDHAHPHQGDGMNPSFHIIPWPEPARVIERLLMMVYPVVRPDIDSLEEVLTVLRAAERWQIQVAVHALKDVLVSNRFPDDDALRIYAFACEMNFEDVRDKVVQRASRRDPCDPAARPELERATALDLLRLIKLRTAPARKFDDHFVTSALLPTETSPLGIVPEAFKDPSADLIVQSSDGYAFDVFKLILSQASPKLKDMIGKQRYDPDVDVSLGRPTLSLPLPAATLATLLSYIYPIPNPDPDDLPMSHIVDCARAAFEWDIPVALASLRRGLTTPERLRKSAIAVYGFACSMGFEDVKRATRIRASLADPVSHNIKTDFKHMMAHDLLDLFDYRRQLGELLCERLQNLELSVLPSFCTHPAGDVYYLGRSASPSPTRWGNSRQDRSRDRSSILAAAFVTRTMLRTLESKSLLSVGDILVSLGYERCRSCFSGNNASGDSNIDALLAWDNKLESFNQIVHDVLSSK